MSVRRFIAQTLITLSSSRYDLNNVERDVKYHIIIIIIRHAWVNVLGEYGALSQIGVVPASILLKSTSALSPDRTCRAGNGPI